MIGPGDADEHNQSRANEGAAKEESKQEQGILRPGIGAPMGDMMGIFLAFKAADPCSVGIMAF